MRHAKTIAILTAAVFPSVVIFCCAIAFAVYWIYDIFYQLKREVRLDILLVAEP